MLASLANGLRMPPLRNCAQVLDNTIDPTLCKYCMQGVPREFQLARTDVPMLAPAALPRYDTLCNIIGCQQLTMINCVTRSRGRDLGGDIDKGVLA